MRNQNGILLMCLAMVLCDRKQVAKVNVMNDTSKEEHLCDMSSSPGCPCHRTETTTWCCHLDLLPSPECAPDILCFTEEIVIYRSSLKSSNISHQFFRALGICPDNIKILRIRNSDIRHVTFSGLEKLKLLDLRGNLVGRLKEPKLDIEALFLSGNNWPCLDPASKKWPRSRSSLKFGLNMSWILKEKWRKSWIDENTTICGNSQNQIQDIETKRDLTNVQDLKSYLVFSKTTLASCPANCDCEVADEAVRFSLAEMSCLKVNMVCTNVGLTDLPAELPPNTIYMDLSHNKISSLDPLKNFNIHYISLERLVLANNSLTSVQGLHTSWLKRNGQTLFDIRHNKIKYFDTITLEAMLSKSSINTKSSFYFSHNPWSCKCQTIKTNQEILEKYSSLIKDFGMIECDNWGSTLLHVDYRNKCRETFDPMIWVIVVEVFLLIFLISNFAWDVFRYKKSGHLPWVARKLCWSLPGKSKPRSPWSTQCGMQIFGHREQGDGAELVQKELQKTMMKYNNEVSDGDVHPSNNEEFIGVRFLEDNNE